MDSITVGIDVSKDRLDIAVRPSGEVFAIERNPAGLEQLTLRLGALSPNLVALEASGGFETVVAAALAAARLPVVVVNPAQIRAFASDRTTCQDRPDRCCRHRPFRRGDQARTTAHA